MEGKAVKWQEIIILQDWKSKRKTGYFRGIEKLQFAATERVVPLS